MAQQTIIDCDCFDSKDSLLKYWNYNYPWKQYPNDHNGTARMFEDCVHAEGGVLTITAKGLDWEEGKSGHDPYLPIRYHSGAIHSKNRVCVNSDWPKMEVKGEFQAPSAPGTWPAFWMVNGHGDWPPELDILEFKGDAYNWQNTFHKPHKCLIAKTRIDHPEHWHSYRAWIELKSHHNIEVHYYVDEKWIACHQAPAKMQDYPMHLIINLQMGGSSGGSEIYRETVFRARNIYVARFN